MMYIACHFEDGENVDLKSIVNDEKIPGHFLSKILQILVRQKLLISMKGPTGGYRLARDPSTISLLDVIEAIDGLDAFTKCGVFNTQCSETHPCTIHETFRKSMEEIKTLYQNEKLNCYKGQLAERYRETAIHL